MTTSAVASTLLVCAIVADIGCTISAEDVKPDVCALVAATIMSSFAVASSPDVCAIVAAANSY